MNKFRNIISSLFIRNKPSSTDIRRYLSKEDLYWHDSGKSKKEIKKEITNILISEFGSNPILLSAADAILKEKVKMSLDDLFKKGLVFKNNGERVGVVKAKTSQTYLARHIRAILDFSERSMMADEISKMLLSKNIAISKSGVRRILYSNTNLFQIGDDFSWRNK